MRNSIIILLSLAILVLGCNKNKFTTKPQLKYKSINAKTFGAEQIIEVKLSFTDAEGDIQDTLYVEKVTRNCANSTFKEQYLVPAFPIIKDSEGEIIVTYGYKESSGQYPQMGNPQCQDINDSCILRFAIQDKKKNKSDTIISEEFVLLYN